MTIKVNMHRFDTLTLYRKSTTEAQRALAGYIIRSGNVNDSLLGGAFHVLRLVEYCNEEETLYELYNLVSNEEKRKILEYVQMAMDGDFDMFMFDEKERKNMMKCLSEPI